MKFFPSVILKSSSEQTYIQIQLKSLPTAYADGSKAIWLPSCSSYCTGACSLMVNLPDTSLAFGTVIFTNRQFWDMLMFNCTVIETTN